MKSRSPSGFEDVCRTRSRSLESFAITFRAVCAARSLSASCDSNCWRGDACVARALYAISSIASLEAGNSSDSSASVALFCSLCNQLRVRGGVVGFAMVYFRTFFPPCNLARQLEFGHEPTIPAAVLHEFGAVQWGHSDPPRRRAWKQSHWSPSCREQRARLQYTMPHLHITECTDGGTWFMLVLHTWQDS
jgi:hypothetical protein